jgi:transcriptional regulator with XRE-family HTH domain
VTLDGLPAYSVNLRRLLAWHGLTNKQAAELLGTTEKTIGSWTNGRSEPSGRLLREIAEYFAVDAVRLFGDPEVFGEDISSVTRWRAVAENAAEYRRKRIREV